MSESSTPDFHPTNFFPLRYEKDLELAAFENHRKKVSFNIASEASYVYILSEEKFIKIAKNETFWVIFKHCDTV